MTCTACGTPLVPGRAFCPGCGLRTAARCGSCGEPLDAGWRFCAACGAPVAGASTAPAESAPLAAASPAVAHASAPTAPHVAPGERKRVTVLFCDLAGSTQIAERLDPEVYRDLLDSYLELVFAEIYRLEGIVNQLAGDGLMALFGAPIAHEDAPQRAVRAALAIHEVLARKSQRLRAERGIELRARIGIHTGMVVVGNVGNDLKMDYTAIGDTTNLAARLQQLAEPGEILISEPTFRQVRGWFETHARGEIDVRGKREPVRAFSVLSAVTADSPMAIAAARGLTPFVGLERELAQFESSFGHVEAGLPQIMAVVGGPGSGKSRLVYEFRQRLAGRGALIVEGRCSALTRNVAYAPWQQLARGLLGVAPAEGEADARAKIDARLVELGLPHERDGAVLARFLGHPAELPEGLSPASLPAATFHAISHVIHAQAERAPVVMVLEDLHWIDDLSREVLERAAARIEGAREMLVVTYRPDFQPSWRVSAPFTQLWLRPLADAELSRIVRARAGGELPPELERRILARAEGNPFFAEEITRALADQELLHHENGHVTLTRPIEQIHIPDTVQETLGARLDRLGGAAKRVAQVAALVGRQFHVADVEDLLDAGLDARAALDELEAQGVVHRKTGLESDEYRFGESLTQEVAYESLLLKERRQLHERVAERLERHGARPELIAHHLARGEDRARAVAALIAAARAAEALPSYRAAFELYQEAWSFAEAALDEGRATETFQRAIVDATLGLTRVSTLFGAPSESDPERAAERGRELAVVLGDRDAEAALAALQGMVALAGDADAFARGMALIERGIREAGSAGLDQRAVTLRRGLVWGYLLDGCFAAANAGLDEIVADLERSGARGSDLWFGARFFRARARFWSDDLDGAWREALDTYEVAGTLRNTTVHVSSAATLALVSYQRADYDAARKWADLSLGIAVEIGNLPAMRNAATAALGALLAQGAPVRGSRYLEWIIEGLGDAGDLAIASHLIVEVLIGSGELARAERVAERARESGGRLRRMLADLAIAAVQREREQYGEAGRALKRALAVAEEIGSRSGLVAGLLGAGDVARARGAADKATEYLTRSLALAREAGLHRWAKRAQVLLG